MSVINQLLLDLEKRRASGAERSTLPDYVRALPNEEQPLQWGWIAAGATVALAALGAGWVVLKGMAPIGGPAAPVTPAPFCAPDDRRVVRGPPRAAAEL